MPNTFHYPSEDTEFWTPIQMTPQWFVDRNDNFLDAIARLGDGVTVEQARAEGDLIAGQLTRQYAKDNAHTGLRVNTWREEMPQQTRLLLTALGAAALCVLLIVCANLASLLLTRALSRRQELAIRTAMGAGRERLVRQLMTESVVLAAAGGVVGVLVGAAAVPLLMRLVPASLPLAEAPHVDLRVLAFAGVLTLVTGVGFGIAARRPREPRRPRRPARHGARGRRAEGAAARRPRRRRDRRVGRAARLGRAAAPRALARAVDRPRLPGRARADDADGAADAAVRVDGATADLLRRRARRCARRCPASRAPPTSASRR